MESYKDKTTLCKEPESSAVLSMNMNTVDKKLVPKPDEEGLFRTYARPESVRVLPYDIRNPVILPKDHQMVIFKSRKCFLIVRSWDDGSAFDQQMHDLQAITSKADAAADGPTFQITCHIQISGIQQHSS